QYDGLVVPTEPRHGPVQVILQLLDEHPDVFQVVGEVPDVTAGAKGPARARDDDAADGRVLVDLEGRVKELTAEAETQRVERLGAVERDRRDSVAALERQELEVHGIVLRSGPLGAPASRPRHAVQD